MTRFVAMFEINNLTLNSKVRRKCLTLGCINQDHAFAGDPIKCGIFSTLQCYVRQQCVLLRVAYFLLSVPALAPASSVSCSEGRASCIRNLFQNRKSRGLI